MAQIVPYSDGVSRGTRRIQVRSSVNYHPEVIFDATTARGDDSEGTGSSTPMATAMDSHVDSEGMKNMDIEAGGRFPDPPGSSNFLRKFLRLMHYMGMSTFNPNVEIKLYRSRFIRFINILLQVAFWTAAGFAITRSFLDAKFFWIYFVAYGGIMKFVSFGYHVINVLVQLAMIRLFAFLHGKISRMLTKLDELNDFEETRSQQQWKREDWLMTALPIMTILKSLLLSGCDTAISNWSIGKMIEQNSKELMFDISVWNAEDLANKNVTDHLFHDIAESPLGTQMTVAFANMLMKFCKEIKLEISIDLIIVVCCCLLKYIRRLNERIKGTQKSSNNNGSDLATLESPTGDWAYYESVAAANNALNAVFDGLLKMMHMYNVMKFAYFLMTIPDNQAATWEFFYLLYTCCRVSIAFHIAKQAFRYNPFLQHWIINWAMRSKESEFIKKAKFALEKIKLNILGLGTGEFVVGESFLLKFGGMVGSIFMLEVD